MKASLIAMAIASGAILLAASPTASAYSTYETTRGDPVRWNRTSMTVTLDERLALVADIDEMENEIAVAFDEWVDSASLPLEFDFVRGECEADGYDPDGGNANCITADESFFGADHDAAATTLLSYVDETGEIRDADIVIRAKEGLWSHGDIEGEQSLRRALLHEVGHFLGMSHSDVEMAVMYPTMSSAEEAVSTDLHPDDLDGVSHLYEDFAAPVEMMCSTATAGSGGGPSAAALAPFLAVLVFFGARRGRNR